MMYFKLALRNAKRSALDYLLYIFTVTILVAILCIANCIAAFGTLAVGFQTASLPLLILFIMAALIDYIHNFMMGQRAKELATYLLLGMEKRKLSLLFFLELSSIGAVCFILGSALGVSVYSLCFHPMHAGAKSQAAFLVIASSIAKAFVSFCLVELFVVLRMNQKLLKLEINRLMNEKRCNQMLRAGNAKNYGVWLLACFIAFLAMLCGIVFLPDNAGAMLFSLIAIPMLSSIFLFYKWGYAYFSTQRVARSEKLYQGTRLYRIAEITSTAETGANTNFVFCSCLLFSAVSFVFGTLMLHPKLSVFSSATQQWMGFLQISICIIFMVIYFSILSVLQIVALKQQAKHLKILHYMGKTELALRALLRAQILLKLFLPAFLCFVLLGVSAPLVNRKLNAALPAAMQDMVWGAFGGFFLCFILLYLSYFIVIYAIGRRYLKASVTS